MFGNMFKNDPITRTPEAQAAVDQQTQALALYHYMSCPFCMRVRNAIEQMSLNIEHRDIQRDQTHRQDLLEGGGKTQVPSLRITHDDGRVEWMYESLDIINYLKERFA